MRKETLTFSKIGADGVKRTATVRGQTAKALRELSKAGPQGVTAMECDTWAYRLAAYCHDLRGKHGLVIETLHENHPGGWHGRHVLQTPVAIEAGESEVA